jgi:hypothetical protein
VSLPAASLISNDKLNYYKFGLGLGAAGATDSKGAEASEAATGGADQYVCDLSS